MSLFTCRWVVALLITMGSCGCSSTLKATKLDADGRFPTTTIIAPVDVKVTKPFSDKYQQMVYVKVSEAETLQYANFFAESLTNMSRFSKVSQKADLEQLVIERKLGDKVSNVSDLIGLNNLAAQIGPFLVVEPKVEFKGGYNFYASLKAVDAETGETVLLLEKNAFNFAGLDKPLFYPLLNGFLEWTQGKSISTVTPQTAPRKKQSN